jgi:hypothetical protein
MPERLDLDHRHSEDSMAEPAKKKPSGGGPGDINKKPNWGLLGEAVRILSGSSEGKAFMGSDNPANAEATKEERAVKSSDANTNQDNQSDSDKARRKELNDRIKKTIGKGTQELNK